MRETMVSTQIPRTNELNRIRTQIRRPRDVLIISPPMTGLTTLLRQTKTTLESEENASGYRVVFIDLANGQEPSRPLFEHVFDLIADHLRVESESGGDTVERLADRIHGLLGERFELQLVVLIDNLHMAPGHEITSFLEQVRVVSEMRSEKQSLKRVAFVLGAQSLDVRDHDPQGTSPFMVAERIYLSDLTDSHAADLVKSIFSVTSYLCPDVSSMYIAHLTRGHPHLIGGLCDALTNHSAQGVATSQKITFELIDHAVDLLCDDGDPLLRSIANQMTGISESALDLLRMILNGARFPVFPSSIELRRLELQGLISSTNADVWQPRNPIIARFLRSQPSLAPVYPDRTSVPRRLFINRLGYEMLFLLENDIRDFVNVKMIEKFGPNWDRRVDASLKNRWHALRQNEQNSAWASTEDLPLLSYSLFPDLKKLIDDEWASIFHEYFKPRATFQGFFELLEHLRNKTAHNRPLTDHDLEQLGTISRSIRKCMNETRARRT